MSLSARRAWIEIGIVVPPKADKASLSARRAWIEIMQTKKEKTPHPVALRKESVDRNRCMQEELYKRDGRSPQGERG